MKKYIHRGWGRGLALILTVAVMASGFVVFAEERGQGDGEETFSAEEIFEREIVQAVIYLCDFYDVKREADSTSDTVVSVSSGTTVQVIGAEANREGLWYYVRIASEETEQYGYVLRDYLAVSNELLLELEAEMPIVYLGGGKDVQTGNGVDQFPESYRSALEELAAKHPNWIFVRYETGLDWDYVVDSEMAGAKSLIGTYKGAAWKGDNYSSGWAYASKAAVRYCMDPRNYLNEESIFQFEQLTYNASYHTVNATQNILQNTFMKGTMPGTNASYAENFVEIGSGERVSPFHLASRVAQEQGTGTSPLISGSYPGYEGYYNYFNIGASGATNEEIYINGLTKARDMGWDSPYSSIQGGARFISRNYILRGQDTLYLQKFDVDSSFDGLFAHQYMQNIEAPNSEALRIAQAYKRVGAFENSFVFKIPVYKNMPVSPCAEPEIEITSADICWTEQGENVELSLVTETTGTVDLEYRWLIYDYATEMWSEGQAWKMDADFTWTPAKTGAYLIQGEVRIVGSDKTVTAVIGYNYVSENEVYIKGRCQMPYNGEGGGYLIGIETNRNPDQKLQYELLILDCTLLAEGKDAWIWSTGRCGVSEGNAFWAVWQPQYGYYWTLFRVYDEDGNMLDEECYGFENVC